MTRERPSTSELRVALARLLAQTEFLQALGREKFVGGDIEASVHQLAASHLVVQFAAVLDDVPEDVRSLLSELPWAQVKGMRNRLAHGYSDLDGSLLWQVIAVDMPDFTRKIMQTLGAGGDTSAQ